MVIEDKQKKSEERKPTKSLAVKSKQRKRDGGEWHIKYVATIERAR